MDNRTAETNNECELSAPEQRVCDRLVFGETNREIANHLNLAEKTVKKHLTSIMKKIGATNRTKAALMLAGALSVQQVTR